MDTDSSLSIGRSKGFITSVKAYDTSSPTILELLTFWFASAMQISGGWKTPEVSAPTAGQCFEAMNFVADVITGG